MNVLTLTEQQAVRVISCGEINISEMTQNQELKRA